MKQVSFLVIRVNFKTMLSFAGHCQRQWGLMFWRWLQLVLQEELVRRHLQECELQCVTILSSITFQWDDVSLSRVQMRLFCPFVFVINILNPCIGVPEFCHASHFEYGILFKLFQNMVVFCQEPCECGWDLSFHDFMLKF